MHYTPPLLAEFVAERLVRACGHGSGIRLRILDPACGDGALLEALLRCMQDAGMLRDCEVVGVETDQQALPEAESKLRVFEHVRLRLISADFLDLASRYYGQAKLLEPPSLVPEFQHPFDIVIANPPYVRTQVLGAERARQLAAQFSLSGRVDLYHAFLVAATEMLRSQGLMGIITSNRFLSTLSGSAIRGYLARKYEIEEVIDLGDTKLFEAAVLPAIFIGRRREGTASRGGQTSPRFLKIYSEADPRGDSSEARCSATGVIDILRQSEPGCYRTPYGVFKLTGGKLIIDEDPTQIWALTTTEEAEWLVKVRDAAQGIFGDIASVHVGIKTTADHVFIRSDWDTLPQETRPERELLRLLLGHEVAHRWSIPKASQPATRVLYPHEVSGGRRRPIDLSRYPRAEAYLQSLRERLEKRHYLVESGRQWYEIWVPQDPDAWQTPKIVFPDISPQPRFYLDLEGRLVDGDCYWITLNQGLPLDMIYLLLAVANSTLMTRFHDTAFNNKLYSARRRYITQYVAKYPYPDPTLRVSQQIIALTKEIVEEASEDILPTDHPLCSEVDVLVQRAFDLQPANAVR